MNRIGTRNSNSFADLHLKTFIFKQIQLGIVDNRIHMLMFPLLSRSLRLLATACTRTLKTFASGHHIVPDVLLLNVPKLCSSAACFHFW